MNVTKPGLALVYRVRPAFEWARDRIVRVEKLVSLNGTPYWTLDESMYSPDHSVFYTKVRDDCLRPIGNPGDDAVDESLLWKPVPSTKETSNV